MHQSFTLDDLLDCYRRGVFPMADKRESRGFYLVEPEMRGLLPLDGFHTSRSLSKFMRSSQWTLSVNFAFTSVMSGCAAPGPSRETTWISENLQRAYEALHTQGDAHSVEVWEGDTLIGGLYGVVIGSAFFGESMFSRRTNASKVALAALVHHLNKSGFTLLDTQYLTDHLESLGGIEISQDTYLKRLALALEISAKFLPNIDPSIARLA